MEHLNNQASSSEKLILISMSGQSKVTTRELSESLGMKIKTVRHYVSKLKKEGMIDVEVVKNRYYLELSKKGTQCLPKNEKKN